MTTANHESVEGRSPFSLSIPDLDARLGLKIRTIVSASVPAMYTEFARSIDVAAMRGRGIVSVISSAQFSRSPVPLPVGGSGEIRTSIRLCDLAAGALGERRKRFGFEVRFELRARPGLGDPLRYRDTAPGAEPVVCGGGRIVLVMLRPAAPMAQRLLDEIPAEVAHLGVAALEAPDLSAESLAEVPAGAATPPEGAPEELLVWGLHNSDVNQNIFAGEYISTLEDAFSRQLHRAGHAVATHRTERASLVFKRPFAPGAAAMLESRAFAQATRTSLVAGFHALSDGGERAAQPSVVARLEGVLGSPER